MIVEADGGPLGVVVAGANVPDTKLLQQTIEAIVVDRPKPTDEAPQHLCLDKGYDYADIRRSVARRGYIPHIPYRGEGRGTTRRLSTSPNCVLS